MGTQKNKVSSRYRVPSKSMQSSPSKGQTSASSHSLVSPSSPPSKRLGQNFLTNEGVVNRIIEALSPTSEETIVEIGPGRGALTSHLIERAGRVVAIEFDRNLIPFLQIQYTEHTNLKLVAGDALEVSFCEEIQPASQARVVANLPYNVSTAILQRLIDQRTCLSEMVLMLQREVVERISAPPGSKERGYFSVFVEAYCETEKLFDVAPGSFRPVPKVWSSVIRLTSKQQSPIENETLMWQIVSAGFAQKRKTILNNLRNAPPELLRRIKSYGGASIILCRAEIDLQRRAETLTLKEWLRLAETLK